MAATLGFLPFCRPGPYAFRDLEVCSAASQPPFATANVGVRGTDRRDHVFHGHAPEQTEAEREGDAASRFTRRPVVSSRKERASRTEGRRILESSGWRATGESERSRTGLERAAAAGTCRAGRPRCGPGDRRSGDSVRQGDSPPGQGQHDRRASRRSRGLLSVALSRPQGSHRATRAGRGDRRAVHQPDDAARTVPR